MEKCSTWNILSILICTYRDVRNAGETVLFVGLMPAALLDEFAPELERRVPVLFPFWKGWMLLGAKSFLRMVRLPLRLRSGLAAKAGMHSTSSVFRRTAQMPYKRLNFGSGPSTAAQLRLAVLVFGYLRRPLRASTLQNGG